MGPSIRRLDADASEYPPRLFDLEDPPPVVYVRGTLPRGRTVGIVGARRASPEGRLIARRLGRDLTLAGATIVSGGAIGIDTEAHLGAIEAGGATLVVLAQPLFEPGPRSNHRLFERALAHGAWLSERDEMPQHRGAFVVRNRLIAAMSDFLIVVEAQMRSGTRSTAEAASRLGRPLGAVPWSVFHLRGEGCLDLIRRGAIVVRSAADVLEAMAWKTPLSAPTIAAEDRPWLDALGRSGGTVDEVCRRVRAPPPDVLRALTRLELRGLIEAVGGGRYIVNRPGA